MPASDRYDTMAFNRCGRSGLKLPAIALGLWHNFAGVDPFENVRAMVLRAFDMGITHFDLANNYGPPPGSAEESMGRVLASDLAAYRDELIISTKAGYGMWPGPYGDFGSRKYLLASLDQSLKRMGLDYVDIFYHHRPDDETPLEESMAALDHAVRSGRALYVGISSYSSERAREAARMLREMGTPCLIHQPSYSMLNRRIEENGLLQVLDEEGVGCIAFCPLAQGMLTNKYIEGIPEGSRVTKQHGSLKSDQVTDEKLSIIKQLNALATERDQSLAQMALRWVLRHETMTTALIGASRPEQIEENVACLGGAGFSDEELRRIDAILTA